MILEASVSLILSPDDLGFFIGKVDVPAVPDGLPAKAIVIKAWFLLIQFVVYG